MKKGSRPVVCVFVRAGVCVLVCAVICVCECVWAKKVVGQLLLFYVSLRVCVCVCVCVCACVCVCMCVCEREQEPLNTVCKGSFGV